MSRPHFSLLVALALALVAISPASAAATSDPPCLPGWPAYPVTDPRGICPNFPAPYFGTWPHTHLAPTRLTHGTQLHGKPHVRMGDPALSGAQLADKLLYDAATQGDLPAVVRLLDQGVSPLRIFRHVPGHPVSSTRIHAAALANAARAGHTDVMAYLIDAGVHPDTPAPLSPASLLPAPLSPGVRCWEVRGEVTPLFHAACAGRAAAVRVLLDDGRVDAGRAVLTVLKDATVLDVAAGSGDPETLRVLMEHPVYGALAGSGGGGRRVRVGDLKHLFRNAAPSLERDMTGTLRYLLAALGFPGGDGAEGEGGGPVGDALAGEQQAAVVHALRLSPWGRDGDALRLLLGLVVPPGGRLPEDIFDVLERAFDGGLMQAAGNANETDHFHRLLRIRSRPPGEELLLRCLISAARGDNPAVVRFLVEEHRLDVNKGVGMDRHDPYAEAHALQAAALAGSPGVVRYLLENTDADIHRGSDVEFEADGTPLWRAAVKEHAEVVGLLLRHGGPVDGILPEGGGGPDWDRVGAGEVFVDVVTRPQVPAAQDWASLREERGEAAVAAVDLTGWDVHLRWGAAEELDAARPVADDDVWPPPCEPVRFRLAREDEGWWRALQFRTNRRGGR
ncbi:hypothetical protein EsH8_X_000691 [Colletotrichum jinshuiense]